MVALCAVGLVACGGGGRRPVATHRSVAPPQPPTTTTAAATSATTRATTTPVAPKPVVHPPPAPAHPQLLPAATQTGPTPGFVPAVRWKGQTVAWVKRTAALAEMRFNQRLVAMHLHSGTIDAGSVGWRYGPSITAAEAGHAVAAFNGGFRLSVGAGGFESFGRFGAPLQNGVASIVTYSDGTTDIGSWRHEVPAAGKQVVSVRQNLTLLIDQAAAAATVGCNSCWGATLGGVPDPARSALGITAAGNLVWVGGETLTVDQLTSALLAAHVVRAAELDINPEWVAGYFYGHRGGRGPLAPVPALPSQNGIPGQYLAPWSRDFFTIVAR